jgi:hypothetical protein
MVAGLHRAQPAETVADLETRLNGRGVRVRASG